MKLEELASVLADIKKQLFTSLVEKSAPQANEALLTELRKRIVAGTNNRRTTSKPAPASKPLNAQQSKFLKRAPQAITNKVEVNVDSLQIEKHGNIYTIGIDKYIPQNLQELVRVTDNDLQQYHETISEETKNQLDQIL